MELTYKNRGKKRKANTTIHVIRRFQLRYHILTGEYLTWSECCEVLKKEFLSSKKIKMESKKRNKKNRRRGTPDVIYLVSEDFRFVVRDGIILTVEIRKFRELNRYKSYQHYLKGNSGGNVNAKNKE